MLCAITVLRATELKEAWTQSEMQSLSNTREMREAIECQVLCIPEWTFGDQLLEPSTTSLCQPPSGSHVDDWAGVTLDVTRARPHASSGWTGVWTIWLRPVFPTSLRPCFCTTSRKALTPLTRSAYIYPVTFVCVRPSWNWMVNGLKARAEASDNRTSPMSPLLEWMNVSTRLLQALSETSSMRMLDASSEADCLRFCKRACSLAAHRVYLQRAYRMLQNWRGGILNDLRLQITRWSGILPATGRPHQLTNSDLLPADMGIQAEPYQHSNQGKTIWAPLHRSLPTHCFRWSSSMISGATARLLQIIRVFFLEEFRLIWTISERDPRSKTKNIDAKENKQPQIQRISKTEEDDRRTRRMKREEEETQEEEERRGRNTRGRREKMKNEKEDEKKNRKRKKEEII